MAGIDKTYVKEYRQYKECKDFAFRHDIEVHKLYGIYASELYDSYKESDFDGVRELPISNTGLWYDRYCMFQDDLPEAIKEYLLYAYGKEEIERIKEEGLFPKVNEDYGRHFVLYSYDGFSGIKKIHHYRENRTVYKWFVEFLWNMPQEVCKKMLNTEYKDESYRYWFDTENDIWREIKYYPGNTNCAHIKTLKSLKRKIKKWKLPINTYLYITGKYTNETLIVKITK
jgi:hypothetical protein